METDSSRLVFDIFREHDTRKVGGDFNFTLDFKWYGCYTSQRTCPVLAKIAGRKTGFQLTSKLVYLAVNLRCDNTPKKLTVQVRRPAIQHNHNQWLNSWSPGFFIG